MNNNIVGVTDPGLAPGLGNYGGPTQTLALYAGSPAIGAGSATIAGVTIPGADQRGTLRPAIGFDIGAFRGSIPAPPAATTPVPLPAETIVATPLVASAAIAPAQGSTTSVITPLVRGHSPFHGRKVNAGGHRQAKAHHAAPEGPASAHSAASARRTVKVRAPKHHPGA